VGTIAGAALGGLAGIALLALLIAYATRRRIHKKKESITTGPVFNDGLMSTIGGQSYGFTLTTPEAEMAPNFLRVVSYNMWKGLDLGSTPDSLLMHIHEKLDLPRPTPSVVLDLREHALQFLSTVVPRDNEAELNFMMEEIMAFMVEALPDLLLDTAMDVVAANMSTSDMSLHKLFDKALDESGHEYEVIGPDSSLYAALTNQKGGYGYVDSPYVETGVEQDLNAWLADKTNPYASATLDSTATTANPYHMASLASPYALATAPNGETQDGSRKESDYSIASGVGQLVETPYDSLTQAPMDDEPEYSMANDLSAESRHNTMEPGQTPPRREPTYDIAQGLQFHDPVYDMGSAGKVGSTKAAEPVYDMGKALSVEDLLPQLARPKHKESFEEPSVALMKRLSGLSNSDVPVYDLES